MASLPLELIAEVASQLCFHCQNPDDYPSSEIDHIHADKQALARLCLTSRAFCAIARPILYHFYVPSKAARGTPSTPGDPIPYDPVRASRDELDEFAHTLTLNPDLAAHLTSIHLSQLIPFRYVNKGIASAKTLVVGKVSWIWWLTCFTARCPRLSTIVVDLAKHRDISFLGADTPERCFPSLRRVVFVTTDYFWVADEMSYMRQIAPNLDELICHVPSTPPRASLYSRPGSTTISHREQKPTLKSLASVSILRPPAMAAILDETTQLEWFEHYLSQADRPGIDSIPFPVEGLSTSLRGLCIGYAPQGKKIPEEEAGGFQTLFPDIWSVRDLSKFEHLEHLSIYCASLNQAALIQSVDVEDKADLLVRLLPPGIRTLRISWVDRDIEHSLLGLAEVARQRFPRLKKVGVGFAEDSIERMGAHSSNGSSIANAIRAGPSLAAQGVTMGWTVDAGGPSPVRTASGERIGNENIPLPDFPLTLEGPEWHIADDLGFEENFQPWAAVHKASLAVRGLV